MLKQNSFSNFKREIYLVYTLFTFGMRDVNESIKKIISDFFITVARFGITIGLYAYLFEFKGGTIAGIDLQIAAWGMFFYFVFMYLNPRYISTDIQRDIQTGKIETILTKPVNYLFFKLGEDLGKKFFVFIMNAIIGFGLMIYFLGIPANILNLNFLFTFPLVILFCYILSFEIYTILGLCAFWIEDIISIRWLLDKAVMILGGAYLPVAFFPPILKQISLYSPIGASQFVTYSAYPYWQDVYLKMFALQILWIVLFGVILYFVYEKAFKKLSVNGG